MPNRDWLLAQHIAYTTEGLGRTRRKSHWPHVLRTIALFCVALAIGIAAVR